jgi:hypothetical protein
MMIIRQGGMRRTRRAYRVILVLVWIDGVGDIRASIDGRLVDAAPLIERLWLRRAAEEGAAIEP